jgi:hypothetical protein
MSQLKYPLCIFNWLPGTCDPNNAAIGQGAPRPYRGRHRGPTALIAISSVKQRLAGIRMLFDVTVHRTDLE